MGTWDEYKTMHKSISGEGGVEPGKLFPVYGYISSYNDVNLFSTLIINASKFSKITNNLSNSQNNFKNNNK